jgi:hypothetical protein
VAREARVAARLARLAKKQVKKRFIVHLLQTKKPRKWQAMTKINRYCHLQRQEEHWRTIDIGHAGSDNTTNMCSEQPCKNQPKTVGESG